jgi:hypothetical protein
MRFKTTLDSSGKNAAGFRVPRDVVEALGKGKRPPVVVTINGYSYRNTVAVYGDEFLIGVAQEHRAPAGVKPGDEIEVDLELDTAPREVDVPTDFAAALEAAPDAKRFFDSLSYSNKRRITLAIEGAKAADTRQRRIDTSIQRLRDGRT